MLTESQLAEIEALTAIFSDSEIVVNSQDNSFTVLLVPDPSQPLDSSANEIGLRLKIVLPPEYPDVTPLYTIIWKKSIDSARLRAIEQVIDEVFKSHGGYELLFDLFTTLTDWLQSNNTPLRSILEALQADKSTQEDANGGDSGDENRQENKDEEDGRLADKTLVSEDQRVTEEEFMAWRDAFRKEMIEAGIWRDPSVINTKPTGKAYFLNISNKVPEASSKVFWQNQELFDNADIDVDDLVE